MSHVARHSTLRHPCADEVHLVGRPREIILRLAEGMEVELWPGAQDHDEQVAWIDAVEARLTQARQMMAEHRVTEEVDR